MGRRACFFGNAPRLGGLMVTSTPVCLLAMWHKIQSCLMQGCAYTCLCFCMCSHFLSSLSLLVVKLWKLVSQSKAHALVISVFYQDVEEPSKSLGTVLKREQAMAKTVEAQKSICEFTVSSFVPSSDSAITGMISGEVIFWQEPRYLFLSLTLMSSLFLTLAFRC